MNLEVRNGLAASLFGCGYSVGFPGQLPLSRAITDGSSLDLQVPEAKVASSDMREGGFALGRVWISDIDETNPAALSLDWRVFGEQDPLEPI